MFSFSLDFKLTRFLFGLQAVVLLSVMTSISDNSLIRIFNLGALFPTICVYVFFPLSISPIVIGLILNVVIMLTIKIKFLPNLGTIKLVKFSTMASLLPVTYFIIVNGYFLSSGFAGFNIIEAYLEAYQTRAENENHGLMGYVFGWHVFFVLPFIPTIIHQKRYITFLFLAMNYMIFYVYVPMTLNILLFVLISAYSLKTELSDSKKVYIFFLGIPSVLLLNNPLVDLIVNRFFYVIGVNTLFYFDYFSQNDFYLFTGSRLQLAETTYSQPIGYIIDAIYYEGLGSNQSAGFFANMFANVGIIGMLISSLVIGVTISILNSLVKDTKFKSAVFLILGFLLINMPLQQIFLSNGLFLLFLILTIIDYEEDSTHNRLLQ